MKTLLLFFALFGLAVTAFKPKPEPVPVGLIVFLVCNDPKGVAIVMSDGSYRLESWEDMKKAKPRGGKVRMAFANYESRDYCGFPHV